MKQELFEATSLILKQIDISKIKLDNAKPGIFVGVGIAALVAGGVYACIQTPKAQKAIEEHKETLEKLKESNDIPETEYRKEVAKTYAKTAAKVVHIYSGPIIVATIGIGCVLKGHYMLKSENAAILASYGTLQSAYDEYRRRVVKTYGEDVDRKIFNGEQEIVVDEVVTDDKGNQKKEKKKVTINRPLVDPYTVIFEEVTSPALWTPVASTNRMNVVAIQAECNRMLEQNGYLFLNDVLRMLGMKETEISRKVGWIKHNPNAPYVVGDSEGFVDFGLFRRGAEYASARYEFLNGDEPSFELHFNVQGVIIDKFEDAATRLI